VKRRISRPILVALLSSTLLAACFGNSAEEYVKAAREALAKGKRSDAVINLKNALQENPKMGEARYLLAKTLLDNGDLAGAEIELGKAAESGYTQDKLVPLQARLMLARGQNEKALAEFGKTQLASAPDMSDLQTSLAGAYGSVGKMPEALVTIEAALKLDAGNARGQLVKARLLAAADRLGDGVQVVEALIAKEGKNSEAWQTKGDLLLKQGRIQDSIAAYRQAAALDKRNTAARAGAFSLLIQTKDLAGAETELKAMKEVAPKSLQTQFFTAVMAYEHGEFKEARDAVQGVLRSAPEDVRVLLLAGRIEARRGALLEAEAYLGKVLTAKPDNSSARMLLAVTELRQGDAAKALSTLQPLLIDDGKHNDALEVAAEASMQTGDTKQAESYFAMIAKSNPADMRSRVALALADARTGKLDQGVAQLRALAASDPGVTANYGLINIHMERKDYADALADIDALQGKMPGKALPFQLRGRVEMLRGDKAKARGAFESALKVDPAFYPAIETLSAMDIADGDFKSAAARFQKVLDGQPKNLSANLGLLAVREKAGASQDELLSTVEKMVRQLPSEPLPRLNLIELQMRRKDVKQALSSAQDAMAALPDNPDIAAALGGVQAVAGDFDQAVSAFNKQIALAPSSPRSYMPLAELYVSRKDNDSAIKTLNRALGVKPDYLPAQMALAGLARGRGDFSEARRLALSVQQQRPKESAGWEILGDTESAQKHWDAAAAAYRTALGKSASTELALKAYHSLVLAGNAPAAKAFETEWMASHASDARFLFFLGEQAMIRQDYAAAEQRFSAVLKIQPDNAMALNNEAWLLFKLRKPGALDLAVKANKLAPDQPAFMDTLAEIHAADGHVDQAAEIEKRAVAAQPNNLGYRLTLAKYYISLGQKDAAKQELTHLAGLSDKLPQQQEAKKLLATL
jgi:putative PEP-CTERM system TPR-repeat lipoprotein